ncbi:MAG: hypothetical protein QOF49_1075, partial [Chloroflexota bacterium]|nr:hypothetical protein [Chloroflexota bacterium]
HGWITDPFGNGPKRVADLVAMASGQFGPLAAIIVVALVVTIIRQPRYALLSGTTMVLTCFFNSVYPDGAIDRYYIIPVVLAWTWLAILGATAIDSLVGPDAVAPRDRALVPGPAGAMRAAGLGAVAVLLIAPSLLALPARARLVDRSGDHGAQAWTEDVLAALEPDAVVVSWWSYSTPLWYATIVDERRPDICIIDDRNRLDYQLGELDQVIDRYIATRPVYLIRNGSSELGRLAGRYTVATVGAPSATNLLRVTPVATGAGPTPAASGAPEPSATARPGSAAQQRSRAYPREACS